MLLAEFPDNPRDIITMVGDAEYHALREQVLSTGHRVDGRVAREVRPISIDIGLLPRAHGSALFTRGQTQALVAVTLGTANDVQRLDTIDEAGETTKSFMLHYNFPPFSTGEVRPVRGTSRREIGHGHLAGAGAAGSAARLRCVPLHDSRRVGRARVQRLLLDGVGLRWIARLFDAGVPVRSAVAGVAMGLIKEGSRYAILTDILGHRRPPRRHGLQGGRHRAGHYLDPDGHQGRGLGCVDHAGSAGAGP